MEDVDLLENGLVNGYGAAENADCLFNVVPYRIRDIAADCSVSKDDFYESDNTGTVIVMLATCSGYTCGGGIGLTIRPERTEYSVSTCLLERAAASLPSTPLNLS
jgi:hypothetical protein